VFHTFLRPGQGFQTFTVLKRQGGLTEIGKPIAESFQPVGQFIGMLLLASQGDITQRRGSEQWKQDGHPILYKIIQHGGGAVPKPGDIVELQGRKLYVLGVHNPAEPGHFGVYFAQKRRDLS